MYNKFVQLKFPKCTLNHESEEAISKVNSKIPVYFILARKKGQYYVHLPLLRYQLWSCRLIITELDFVKIGRSTIGLKTKERNSCIWLTQAFFPLYFCLELFYFQILWVFPSSIIFVMRKRGSFYLDK